MAGGIDFRLTATQADALKKSLEQLGPAGEAALARIKTAQTASELEKATQRVDALKSRLETLGTTGTKVAGEVEKVGQAAQRSIGGVQLAGYQVANLSQQLQDFGVQVASGQSALTAFAQQAPQAAFAVGGFGNLVKLAINPVTLLGAAVVGLGAGFIAMAAHAETVERTFKGFETSLAATGRASVASRADLASLIEETAKLPGINRAAAESAVSEFAKTRAIAVPLFAELTKIVGGFARATGDDAAEAAKELAKAIADPAKGAKELSDRFGILTAEQLKLITSLAEGGNRLEAQRILADALNERFGGLARGGMTELEDKVDSLSKAWDRLKRAVMGGAAVTADPTPALQAELAGIDQRIAAERGVNVNRRLPRDVTIANLEERKAEITAQLEELAMQRTSVSRAAGRQNFLGTGQAREDVLKGADALRGRYDAKGAERSEITGDVERLSLAYNAAVEKGDSTAAASYQAQIAEATKKYEETFVEKMPKAAKESTAELKEFVKQLNLAIDGQMEMVKGQGESAKLESERTRDEIKRGHAFEEYLTDIETETRLLALSKEERAVQLALIQASAKAQGELTDQQKADVRAAVQAREVAKSQEQAAQEAIRVWDRTADRISDALGDALLQTSGNFWEAFKLAGLRAVADIFSANYIRPFVSAAFGAFGLGSGAAMAGVGGGGAAGGGGIGFGDISNGASLLNFATGGSLLSGIGSTLGSTFPSIGNLGLFGASGLAAAGAGSAAASGALAASGLGLGVEGFSLAAGGAASFAPMLAAAMPYLAPIAIGAGFLLPKLLGGKPSVGPGGGSGVLIEGGSATGRFLGGDNGYTGGATAGLAQQSAQVINQLAQRLGTSVTGAGEAGFGEGQGRLWLKFASDQAMQDVSPQEAVAAYVKGAIERGALAGINSLDDAVIGGALSGKLEEVLAGQAVARASAELSAELQQTISLQAQYAEALSRTSVGITEFLAGLKVSDLSPLTGAGRLAEARGQYADILRRAEGGDINAAGQASDALRTVLSISRTYSPAGYSSDYAAGTASLERLGGSLAARAVTERADLDRLTGIQAEIASGAANTVAAVDALRSEVAGMRTDLRLFAEANTRR